MLEEVFERNTCLSRNLCEGNSRIIAGQTSFKLGRNSFDTFVGIVARHWPPVERKQGHTQDHDDTADSGPQQEPVTLDQFGFHKTAIAD
jgi:hypothetical protein